MSPSTDQAPELPGALWRAYRAERRRGSKARQACSAAFEEVPGYTKSDTRETLAQALLAREAEQGLAISEAEREREILAEAQAVDDAEPDSGSMEAIERDAVARVQELRAQIERMAPEALKDAKVAAEQRDAESQLADAERALVNVERARRETGRRDVDAAERAERERRESATSEAAKLEPVIAAAKADVDAKAAEWVTAVVNLRDVTEQRAAQVAAAMPNDNMAIRGARFRPDDVLGALRAALRGRIHLGDGLGAGRQDTLLAAEPEGE